jgi:hypothetical protein
MSQNPLEAFATYARAYCEAFERFRTTSPDVFLAGALLPLSRIYAAALELPDLPYHEVDRTEASPEDQLAPEWVTPGFRPPHPLTEELAWESWYPLQTQLSGYLGDRDLYRTVFDAWAEDRPTEVVGTLSDDLVDIYKDLLLGLRYWDRGQQH